MSVAKKAVRGAAWTIPSSILSRAIGLAGTLLLARFLVPDEYGEVSAASILVLTASQFSSLGVGVYVIANPKAPRAEVFHAWLFHVVSGVFALAIAVALGGKLGPVFDAPTMGQYVPGLALAVMMDRVAFIPERTLIRELHFRTIAMMRSVGEVTFTAVSIWTAYAGAGAMCIVWGNLARSAVRMIITVIAAERRDWLEFSSISWTTMKKLISYGATVSLAGIAGFCSRRWDNLLVSRYFGPAVMGAYNYAYNLADVPAVQVGEQITDVLQASFPHLPPEKRPDALVRAIKLLALIMFPLAVGLGATAPTVVHAFFNRKWVDIAPMLMLLCVLSVPRPIASGLTSYLHGLNRPREVMWLEWFALAVLMGSIVSFGRLGPRWTCAAVGFAFTVRMLANMWLLQKKDGISMTRMLRSLVAPLVACVPLLGAVIGLRHELQQWGVRPVISLFAEVTAGALVYVGAALLIARDASRELLSLVKSALARRRPSPPDAAAA